MDGEREEAENGWKVDELDNEGKRDVDGDEEIGENVESIDERREREEREISTISTSSDIFGVWR